MSNLKIFSLAFIFSLPIFISITNQWSISLSRYVNDMGPFIATLPASFIISSIYIFLFLSANFLKNQLQIGGDKILGFVLLTFPLLAVFLYVTHFPGKMFIFIYTIFFYLCASFYLTKITYFNYLNLIKSLFYLQMLYGLLSYLMVNNYAPGVSMGTLIPGVLVIYNYEQYYSFGSALCAGLLIMTKNTNLYKKLFYFGAGFFLSTITENVTSQLFILALLFLSLITMTLSHNFVISLKPSFFIIGFLFSISIPIFSWFFYEYFPNYVGSPTSHGMWSRIIIHHHWIESINFFDLLLPLTSADWFHDWGWQPHHQLLNSLWYGGIFLLILNLIFNLIIVSKAFSYDYIVFGFFYFFVGSAAEPLTHPFLLLQFYLLVAASNVVRKKELIFLR